ncbi:FkbM family methyltransferase [Chloroflexota bacterium]
MSKTKLNYRTLMGLLRSLWMYYSVPFQARGLGKFYSAFIQPGDLCFDIGAHVGSRLRVFSRMGARVVALEPQPLFADLLRLLFGRKPNVTLLQKAVGAQIGEAQMLVSERAPTVSSLSGWWVVAVQARDRTFQNVNWNATLKVEVTTLDALIEAYGQPAFIKIDVEGYELEALKGLTKPVKALSFEYIATTLEIPLGCVDYLRELAVYEFNYTIIEAVNFALPEWVDADQIIACLEQLPLAATSGDVYARRID